MRRKALIFSLAAIMAATCFALPTASFASDGSSAAAPQAIVKNYNTVKLTWSRITGATGYKVFMSYNRNAWPSAPKKTTSGDVSGYTVTGLTTGKTVYFKVIAITEGVSQAKTTAAEPVSAVPKLTGTSVKGYAKSRIALQIKWSRVAGATGYVIYRYNSNTGKYRAIKRTGRRTTGFVNSNLASGTTYAYKVRAYRTSGGVTARTDSAVKKLRTPKKLTRQTPGFSKTNAGKLISVCRSRLGCAYVSGASGPRAFDCSGYVYWVYKKANVSSKRVPRTSAQGLYSSLKKYCIGRSLSNAQPGDIILFSSGGSRYGIRHAAIYYGNNKLIHASNPSTGVCITGTGWSGGQAGVAVIIRLPNM